jgi:uncharacterized protein (DUF58 family)
VTETVSPGWRPTAALTRAALVSATASALAVTTGRVDLLVLGAPFLLHAAVVVVRRPLRSPRIAAHLDHTSLREGEATTARVRLSDAGDAEHAVLALTRSRWTALRPPDGVVGWGPARGETQLELAVPLVTLRWGRRPVGEGAVAATGPWAGRIWGPRPVPATTLTTLPLPGVFDSRAPVPHPIGLVGTHQARRAGSGTEFASIRPFTAGDRLRRVHWPVSLRTGTLHVTTTVAEEDSSVLLIVDSGVEVGVADGPASVAGASGANGGVGGAGGPASSLDVAVRAAGAVAEHYLQRGDRVAVRVLGSTLLNSVPFGGGLRHLRRVLDTLARIVPGEHRGVDPARMRFPVPPGTVVVLLSPMLSEQVVGLTRVLAQRGLDLVVVDTLPPDIVDREPERALAWRMRLLEREALLLQVARAGVPVVAWRGPGTLDDVLRGLGRRTRLPRVAGR